MNEENTDVRKKLLDDRDKRHSLVIKNMISELQKQIQCTFTYVLPYKNVKYKGIKHAIIVTHKCEREKGHEGNCSCCKGLVIWSGWTK